jgi:hypothetical protein
MKQLLVTIHFLGIAITTLPKKHFYVTDAMAKEAGVFDPGSIYSLV